MREIVAVKYELSIWIDDFTTPTDTTTRCSLLVICTLPRHSCVQPSDQHPKITLFNSVNLWWFLLCSPWGWLKLWGVFLMAMTSFIPLILQSGTCFNCLVLCQSSIWFSMVACSSIADLYSSAWELFFCWQVKDGLCELVSFSTVLS